ncbi:PLP-dependent aminotransferase family protein [Roseiflexus sp.]|uniref:aminotransferase-like domain-containing protein n=1 Tax=Roseiflexus sp. TaxID=2562120 RepID=UPI00398ADD8A
MSVASAPVLGNLYAARAKTLAPAQIWPEHEGDLISLAYGFAAPELFPTDDLLSATAEVLAEDAAEGLNYGPTYPRLVELVANRLRAQGTPAEPDNILIAYGSSQILALLPQVFIDPGDAVIVEGPTFMGAVRHFALAGANLITVDVDEQGLNVDALEATLRDLAQRGQRAKFIYTIPTFHNPSGTLMPLERRQRLVALAKEYGVLIVEDDAYGDLYFENPPPLRLSALDHDGWVLQVGTFSKILAPGLRMGWACGSHEIIQRLASFKVEGSSGPFLTRVVERYCADGRLERHIADLRVAYRARRDLMLATIAREWLPEVRVAKPEGGFFVWARLPQGLSATALLSESEKHGVTFVPGTHFYANGQGDNAFRLSFSFVPLHQIEDGIARIGAALRVLSKQAGD